MRRRLPLHPSLRCLPALVLAVGVVALLSAAGCLTRKRERVVVVGAGAAGLASATALSAVADVLVLEAQERVGGRVHTNRSLGVPIELGAVWIHRADGNVVSALASEYGCESFVSQNKELHIHDEAGAALRPSLVREVYAHLSRVIMPDFLRRRTALGDDPRRDVDMQALMRRVPSAAALAGERRCIFDFLLFRDVVQDHTADLRQSSAREYDTDLYGGSGRDEVLPGGYDCIVRGMARELQVRTGRAGEVTSVRYGEAWGVELRTADGAVVTADRVILTLPLGVLKAGLAASAAAAASAAVAASASTTASTTAAAAAPLPRGAVRFDPPMPARWRLPIAALGWGEAIKVPHPSLTDKSLTDA